MSATCGVSRTVGLLVEHGLVDHLGMGSLVGHHHANAVVVSVVQKFGQIGDLRLLCVHHFQAAGIERVVGNGLSSLGLTKLVTISP